MSPVNQAGSVSEISPATPFFVKISMCSYEGPGWPGYRNLGFCDRDLGTGMKMFPYENSCPVTGTKRFRQNSFAFTR